MGLAVVSVLTYPLACVAGPRAATAVQTTSVSFSPDDLVAAAGLVDVDVTMFVQFGLFLVLAVVLPRLIFAPLMERFEQRAARTEGARADARRVQREADQEVATFERAMSDEKQRALAERQAARMQAQREAQQLIQRVRTETAARMERGMADLAQAAQAGRTLMDTEARELAGMIVTTIVKGRAG